MLTGVQLKEDCFVCVFIGIMAKRVAVILSGCGVYDGTEVHEASAVLVHLSRAGAKVRTRKGLLHIHLCAYLNPVTFGSI